MHAQLSTESGHTVSVDASIMDVLRLHDDPLSFETPHGFDRQEALRALRSFVRELEDALGHRLDYETVSSLDEASFHGELYLHGAALRFSNFGRMVALTGQGSLNAHDEQLLVRMAEAHGYRLVPSDLLAARSTGRNPRVAQGRSWYARFFG